MVHKKKSLGFLKLLSVVFVMLFSVGFSSTCNANAIFPDLLPTDNQWYQIISYLNLINYSGDNLSITHNTFNEWMTSFVSGDEIASDMYWQSHAIIFSKSGTNSLQWCIVKDPGLTGGITDFFVNSSSTYNDYLSSLSVKNTFLFRGISDWIRSNDSITGYTMQNFTYFYIPSNNLTGIAVSNNQSVFNAYNGLSQKVSVTDIYYHGIDVKGLFIPSIIGFYPYNNVSYSTIDHDNLVPINSRTYEAEWGTYYLTNTVSGEYVLPEPTPTPTATPTATLNDTNNLISEIIGSINDVPSGDDFIMPSSGDIMSASTYQGWESNIEVTNSTAFWSTITTQLGVVLTNDIRFIPFEFLGETYTLDNRAFVVTDERFASFLRVISTTLFVVLQYKIIRKLGAMFSSGVFGQILRAYAKVDISDLF